ncbi:DUF6503 family protein [Flagellimonas sp. S3867]|uniref:DUF6503 family protein n=1 Tax=Flagellimonas sp. S3867 TaxID=2768063 RepID=UPI001681D6A5|nr:DUF6503 family protein [Flagellimonas sp. S3867]
MRKLSILLLAFIAFACKNNSQKEVVHEEPQPQEATSTINYPEALKNVFTAHGGLKNWKSQRTLTYEMPKPKLKELHIIDLWTRKDRVDTEKFSMGSNGEKVWLLDAAENYKGDAVFYHNLMFYFYAMPFVLADDGIHYGETEALEYDGKSYPGIRIYYDSGVGTSPKDEYFIHFDAETHKMAWLGYTVTYRTGEISDNVKWIRYDDWQEIDGLTLPKAITWYNYEGTKILDARSTVNFENVTLTKTAKPEGYYAKPEGGNFVEAKNSN